MRILPLLMVLASFAAAQTVQPAPDPVLLNSGYGAAALGMGGAFHAVADDLSAVYWNPAGVARISGFQFFTDYSISGDSDIDNAAEVQPNSFQSLQRYSITGNQFHSFAASYSFQSKSYRFTPLFAWQRTSLGSPERELKDPADLTANLTPGVTTTSEGTFSETTSSDEHEWAAGISVMVSSNILFGATLNFLSGKPETKLNGSYVNTYTSSAGTVVENLSLNQTTTEDLSGTYFKIGMLFFPEGPVRFGGNVRFPYTRTSTLSVRQTGTETGAGGSIPVDQSATAKTSVDVPMEWSAGVAFSGSGAIVSASMTYADWSTAVREVKGSTDPLLIPEDTLPFPLLRFGGLQNSLLQYRVGTEYVRGNSGVVVRAGYFWDGQPYGNGERVYLHGFTAGAGYMARTFRVDAAFFSEHGDPRFTAFSAANSKISQRRFYLSLSLLSQ